MRFAFIDAEKAHHSVRTMCRVLKVSPSCYSHSNKDVLRGPLETAQYAAHAYRNVLHRHGIVCLMSRQGDCWDNAIVEGFFSRLKTELLHRQSWRT